MSLRPSGVGVGVVTGMAVVYALLTVLTAFDGQWDYVPLFGVAALLGAVLAVMSWREHRRRVERWKKEEERLGQLRDLAGGPR